MQKETHLKLTDEERRDKLIKTLEAQNKKLEEERLKPCLVKFWMTIVKIILCIPRKLISPLKNNSYQILLFFMTFFL